MYIWTYHKCCSTLLHYLWSYKVHGTCEEHYIIKIQITVEPLYCGHHGTTAVCLDYRGIRISEASSIIPVGVVMHTRAVECYEDAFYSSPLLYACEKGWPEARTMRTNAIIMFSCWIDQRWRTNLRERQGSVRIIQWIVYSPGTKGTEELVRFTE